MTTQRPTPFNSPRRGLTRRQLLARAGALGAAGISLPAFLAACGSDGDSGSAGTTPASGTTGATTGGSGGGSLFFENWPAYIDPTEDGLTGTVDRFMEATGIDMRYTEAYNDNTEYFAKIQPILGRGETIDPDIIAPTGWMAGRLLTLGWLDKLPARQGPQRRQPARRPAGTRPGIRPASTPFRGRPASPASPTTSMSPAAS